MKGVKKVEEKLKFLRKSMDETVLKDNPFTKETKYGIIRKINNNNGKIPHCDE